MIIAGRRFKPAGWSILLTLAAVVLFVALGNWQLQRAAYKASIEQKFNQRLGEDYRRLRQDADLEDIEYRKLRLSGRYESRHTLLLDNQLHQGRAGYHVLTPFELNDSDAVILVDRGWAAWGDDRETLPAIEPAGAAESIAGIAYRPELSVFRLGRVELGDEWPQLIPFLDLDALRVQYSERLLPVVLWLAPEQPGSYLRDWQPVWLPPEKSRAYAAQWFCFAGVALLLFFILNLRKIE